MQMGNAESQGNQMTERVRAIMNWLGNRLQAKTPESGQTPLVVKQPEEPDVQVQALINSVIFDRSHYQAGCGKVFTDRQSAIEYFVGSSEGSLASPSPLFDCDFYLDNNPDVAESSMNPLVHFLMYGGQEGRSPHPQFNSRYYLDSYHAFFDKAFNPLEHFLTHSGVFHHFNPNPDFSVAEYYASHPEALSQNENALVHYLKNQTPTSMADDPDSPDESSEFVVAQKHPSGSNALIVTSHDASRTGAPLIILKILEVLTTRYALDCKIILLSGGPLKPEFEKFGEVFDLQEMSQGARQNPSLVRDLVGTLLDGSEQFAVCNSACCHMLINELEKRGLQILSLVHEFADTFPPEIVQKLINASTKVIVPAGIVRESYQQVLNQDLPDLTVLPQGVFADRNLAPQATDALARQQARQRVIERDSIPPDAKIVLGCGYVDNRKGCDIFMLTCQTIKRTHPELDFVFIWVGMLETAFTDATFGFWLNSDLKRTDLDDRLFFVGERSNPEDYFLAADVFYMCSRLDPFPCVVLEAMSAGLPVVCFDSTVGSVDLLKDGAGIVVPPFDVVGAAESITAFIEDDELRETTGEAGRRMIEDRFQFEHYVDALTDHLGAMGMDISPHEAPPTIVDVSAKR